VALFIESVLDLSEFGSAVFAGLDSGRLQLHRPEIWFKVSEKLRPSGADPP
jgi:hypothetical protein